MEAAFCHRRSRAGRGRSKNSEMRIRLDFGCGIIIPLALVATGAIGPHRLNNDHRACFVAGHAPLLRPHERAAGERMTAKGAGDNRHVQYCSKSRAVNHPALHSAGHGRRLYSRTVLPSITKPPVGQGRSRRDEPGIGCSDPLGRRQTEFVRSVSMPGFEHLSFRFSDGRPEQVASNTPSRYQDGALAL